MQNEKYNETRRKWFLQMNPQEVYAVRGAILKFAAWVFSPHALKEMQDDRITEADARKVLMYGKVMEVHNCDPKDVCAVVRHTINNRSVAVVVSLVTGRVVTAFANTVQSGMRRPDMKNYKWTADVSVFNQVSPDNVGLVA